MYNLIDDPWIEVVRKSGKVDLVSPLELWDEDTPMRLCWPRADFDLACIELLIGLLYAADPPEDNDDWAERSQSVDGERWKKALRSLTPYFNLNAQDGPRFLQDFDTLDGETLPLERLLIDAPGENALKNNTDHFFKRSSDMSLSWSMAAILLYTFQTFAPAGGSGHRTSLRGGGPMVTLVDPSEDATLFEKVWANVPTGEPLPLDDKDEVARAFPWTRKTVTSEKKNAIPIHEYDAHGAFTHWGVFFGMPRRIRLVFSSESGVCSLSNRSVDTSATGFVQRTFGFNYGSWLHPTTPYYRQKANTEQLPLHPKPGRFGYQNYLGVIFRTEDSKLRSRALTIDIWAEKRGLGREVPRILVAGWAMDNMKALDFVYSSLPVPLSALSGKLEAQAGSMVESAEILSRALFSSLRNALKTEAKVTDAPTLARREFFNRTEEMFIANLNNLGDVDDFSHVNDRWRKDILEVVISIFDSLTQVLVPDVKPDRAKEILDARRLLLNTGLGFTPSGKKLFATLSLKIPENVKRKKVTAK